MLCVDIDRCTGCGRCVVVCEPGAIAIYKGRARIDEARCTGCGACIEACPEDALLWAEAVEAAPALPATSPTKALQVRQPGVVAAVGTALLAIGRAALPAIEWALERLARSRERSPGEQRGQDRVRGGHQHRHRGG